MASETMRRRTTLAGIALVVIAALFVAVVVLANTLFTTQRIDLTEQKLFTLSEGSERVIASIDEPITLRFYYSSRLGREIPAIGIYAQRVRDLLEEYEALSDGAIRLEVYDPLPFTEVEDRAVAAGLQGVPVDQSGEVVYFGLAGTNATDGREVIPFFDQSREQFLEYDLTRLIYTLANPEKPKLGLMSSLEVSGSRYARQNPDAPDDSWISYSQLAEQFEVEELLQSSTEIPEDIDVLLLIHPKSLTDEAIYAIDQFLMRGGKLLAFTDPHSEADAARPRQGQPPAMVDAGSSINDLTEAWGVTMPLDEVVGDIANARRVQAPTETGSRVAAIDYPLWMQIRAGLVDPNDPVTSDLNTLNIASPGHIEVADDAKLSVTPLILTSERSGTVDTAMVREGSPAILRIAAAVEPTQSYVLAARLSGRTGSIFPDGPPKPQALVEAEEALEAAEDEAAREKQQAEVDKLTAEWEKRREAHLAEPAEDLNVVLVADVDMLADALWVQVQDFFGQRVAVPMAQNGFLLVNAAENLAGSSDLISLRSRGVVQRPFTMIQSIQREAERGFRAKEQELLQSLQQTEAKMRELQQQDGEPGQGGMVISEAQQAEIDRFREEVVRIRRELRDVQFELRRDVESLTTWIKVLNIGAVPLAVAIVAIVIALVRRRARRRYQAVA